MSISELHIITGTSIYFPWAQCHVLTDYGLVKMSMKMNKLINYISEQPSVLAQAAALIVHERNAISYTSPCVILHVIM